MCVRCEIAVKAAKWVLDRAAMSVPSRIPDSASIESMVLGMSKGGWEGWMQEEMVVPLSEYFNVFREVRIYNHSTEKRVDLLIDERGMLKEQFVRLYNFDDLGAWGIELKCQGLFQDFDDVGNNVLEDFTKIASEFQLRNWQGLEASPLISLVVWLNTSAYQTKENYNGTLGIKELLPLFMHRDFKRWQMNPMRGAKLVAYENNTVRNMWTIVAYHPKLS